ncbi:MAG: GNAT family N-acetyltransferase [Actinomycetota bacterium]|nr:GNAT family N-acetyltransferase [Actinomycetota bacterium]
MSETIRTYRDEDLDTCRELWVELTEWHRSIYNSPGIGGNDPGLQFDEHLTKVGPGHIWLAEINGTAVGMVGLIHDAAEGSVEVEPLIVRPDARGRGIARRLIDIVVEATRAFGVRDVNVRAVGRNAEAILPRPRL